MVGAGLRPGPYDCRQPVACQPFAEAAPTLLRRHDERAQQRFIATAFEGAGADDALAEAHKAVTGDISGVTEGLGVAFNSTLVALLLSLVLMFLLHGLQLAQERLALDAETYLDNRLLRNLQVR